MHTTAIAQGESTDVRRDNRAHDEKGWFGPNTLGPRAAKDHSGNA
jgi:hypothetical protein